MQIFTINLVPVIIAAFINMVIGSVWYSPILFSKTWLKLVGKSEKDIKKKEANKMYTISAVASVTAAFVLAYFIQIAGATTALEGAIVSLWVWVGFVATTTLAPYLFEGRKLDLYYLYISYQLVSFVFMGMLLGLWR